jgi:hypothetical protein
VRVVPARRGIPARWLVITLALTVLVCWQFSLSLPGKPHPRHPVPAHVHQPLPVTVTVGGAAYACVPRTTPVPPHAARKLVPPSVHRLEND